MVEVTMKFPFLLHSVLKGLTFFWPLLLILTPFGYIAAFFWRKLRYKWLLLVNQLLEAQQAGKYEQDVQLDTAIQLAREALKTE